jgi:hypothetical protein
VQFSLLLPFELTFFCAPYVLQIVGSTKALQVIAAITAERDVTLRNVSLLTLATAYKILGTAHNCSNKVLF